MTPLFISDSHRIETDPDHPEHKIYRFFEYDGKPALPASSLPRDDPLGIRGGDELVLECVGWSKAELPLGGHTSGILGACTR